MKKRIKNKWVKALRSGKYQQTTGALREGDSFCCLGVLCNIHAQEHPEIAAKQKSKGLYLGAFGLLPQEVVKWAGLEDKATDKDDNADISVVYRGKETSLSALNDGENLSFKKIARIIDRCL